MSSYAALEDLLRPRAPWLLADAHPGAQAWTWAVFFGILALAWFTLMGKLVTKLYDDTDQPRPLRRTYIIAFACYACAQAWLQMLFLSCLLFVGLTVLFIIYSFLPPVPELLQPMRNRVQMCLSPVFWLAWLKPHHLAAHGVILLAAMAFAFVPALCYVTQGDLASDRVYTLRAKVLRILFAMPVLCSIGYLVYAGTCVTRALAIAS